MLCASLRAAFLKEPALASGFMFTWQREVESPRSLNDWKREPEPAGGAAQALAVAYAWPSPHRPAMGPRTCVPEGNQTEWLRLEKRSKLFKKLTTLEREGRGKGREGGKKGRREE